MSRIGYILFFVFCLLVALTSLRFLVFPMEQAMGWMNHHVAAAPVAAYGHMLFGPLALALAPLQFSTGLRRRRPALHRILGRIAAMSMVIAGAAALALLPGFKGTPFAAAGFAALGGLWIGFTLIAVQAARVRDLARHRAFMMRATALSFGAVMLRILMAPLMARGWTVVETYDVTAWGCWLPSLLLVELWLARQRKRAPAGAL